MSKNKKKCKFTLVEITVAFGVFAILIMVLMQFLFTAQGVWNFSEKRSRAYAEKQAFMNFLDRAVESAKGGIEIDNNNNGKLLIKRCIMPGTDNFCDLEIKFHDDEKDNADGILVDSELNVDSLGLLVANSEDLIANVIKCQFNSWNSILTVRLEMFGCEEDFKAWKNESSVRPQPDKLSPREQYFNAHGFVFTSNIVLP